MISKARTIDRTPQELRCLEIGRQGLQPSAKDICATIYTVDELKGYKDALQRSGRLDDEAKAAIMARLHWFETLFRRKIT